MRWNMDEGEVQLPSSFLVSPPDKQLPATTEVDSNMQSPNQVGTFAILKASSEPSVFWASSVKPLGNSSVYTSAAHVRQGTRDACWVPNPMATPGKWVGKQGLLPAKGINLPVWCFFKLSNPEAGVQCGLFKYFKNSNRQWWPTH